MLQLEFHPDVNADLRDVTDYYEELANGLGSAFLLSVRSTLLRVRRFPYLCPVVREPFRRAIVPRFPFGLVYIVSASAVRLIAVYPLRSDPQGVERLLSIRSC